MIIREHNHYIQQKHMHMGPAIIHKNDEIKCNNIRKQ